MNDDCGRLVSDGVEDEVCFCLNGADFAELWFGLEEDIAAIGE